MKIIFENPEAYGFYLKESDIYLPISTHNILIDGKVDDLADLANDNGISYKILKYFNPWLRQSYLKNKKKKKYYIQIPDPPYDVTHEEIILNQNGIIINK